jgi:hypothetical protein
VFDWPIQVGGFWLQQLKEQLKHCEVQLNKHYGLS